MSAASYGRGWILLSDLHCDLLSLITFAIRSPAERQSNKFRVIERRLEIRDDITIATLSFIQSD